MLYSSLTFLTTNPLIKASARAWRKNCISHKFIMFTVFYPYALPSAVISWMPVPAASLRTSLYSNWLGIFLNTYALLFWELTGKKVIVWRHPSLTHPPLLLTSCSGIRRHIRCQGIAIWESLTKTKIKPAPVYISSPSLRSHTQAV